MNDRAHNRAFIGAVILTVSASGVDARTAGPPQDAAPSPSSAPATTVSPERPSMSLKALRRLSSRNIGDFPDDASALAARRAAGLPRRTYATAVIDRQHVVIAPNGTIYNLPLRQARPVRAGRPVRPPQRAVAPVVMATPSPD